MQIEQYHRKEIPTGSAGNVINRQPNSYAELEQLGKKMFDVGLAMEQQRLKAEYHDQMNSAQLEVDKRFLEFEESLDPNNTAKWEPDTDTLHKGYEDVVSKMSNGKARDDFSARLEQQKLRQKSAILSYRRETDARNFSARYQVNYREFMQIAAKQPTPGEYDQSRESSMRSLFGLERKNPEKAIGPDNVQTVEGYENPLFQSDQLRFDQARAWLSGVEKVYEQNQKDALSERIVGEAMVMTPEQATSYLDAANEIASREYGLKEGFFDGKELTDLKQEYRQRQNIAEAEKNDRGEIFVKNVTQKILQGLPSNAKAEQIREFLNMRQEILDNQDISGPQISTLTNMLDSYIEKMGNKSPQENDSESLAQAYKIMTTDLTQQQKFERLMSLKTKLKSTTVDGFIQDIYKPETVSNEIYKEYASAITSLKTGKMFSINTAENINLSVKAQDLLRMFAQQNPDATQEEYAQFFNKLIENQARWWAVLPGGRPWSARREKSEQRLSIPQNIKALQKEMAALGQTAAKQYKAGDKRTVNGVNYTYDGQYWTD